MLKADLIIMEKRKEIHGMEVSILVKEGPDLKYSTSITDGGNSQ